MAKLSTLYIPHGGGPCFFMEWTMGPRDTWKSMEAFLRGVASRLPEKPKAILVISAHWEAPEFSMLTKAEPELLFDYYGFPQHTYALTYPAKNPAHVVARVQELLAAAGQPLGTDSTRGYDHGVFVPFKLIYPDAEIPVAQLSLKQGLNPAQHIELGKLLEPLRNEGVLIVGSGMSYHNLRSFGQDNIASSQAFDAALSKSVMASTAERTAQLSAWEKLPNARQCHPREEHLLPLMVVAGAAGDDAGSVMYSDVVMGAQTSAYQFG